MINHNFDNPGHQIASGMEPIKMSSILLTSQVFIDQVLMPSCFVNHVAQHSTLDLIDLYPRN